MITVSYRERCEEHKKIIRKSKVITSQGLGHFDCLECRYLPSSKHVLIAVNPEAPAPIMATLLEGILFNNWQYDENHENKALFLHMAVL